ncbi:MAG: hypothetical protein OXJ55_08750 [Caldilineaceae bacterium]|nr:hypothetical protein [Caldilineaceae bacterium]MDE0461685.1 hypothetical protein [Caldilineaceae bacterium]MDE0462993.1 hypothetical protein [Caldilineaceae bacterium]
MTEERQQKQEEKPSIQTQLNDVQKEKRHVAQPHQQRQSTEAARAAEHTRVAGNAVEAARIGILQLEEAILDILLEGMQENRRIGLSEITRRTGLPGGGRDALNDWAAWSFLQKLVGEHRAIYSRDGRYELTQTELDLHQKTRDENNPETIAQLGLLQVENAILDCLSKGVRPADITHRLRLPINATYFLQKLVAQYRVRHVAHGRYELIQNPQK